MTPSFENPALFRQQAYVAGQWTDALSGTVVEVFSPSTGQPIGHVPDCGREETLKAIAAAIHAQKAWKRRSPLQRATILMRWHALIIENINDLAALMTFEQGKTLREAEAEIRYGASFFEWYAAEARRGEGDIVPAPMMDRKILVVHEPIGVTAAITPWNFPAAMITRKCAPALAAGCAMIIKPSELTPFSALAIAALGEDAGVPPGLLSVVTGKPEAIGGVLTSHPEIRALSFTGSTRVGAMLMQQSSDTIKRMSLELGGNAPFIVFDDANIETAIDSAIASKFRNGGQTCICANRFIVQDGIHDRFVAGLVARVRKMRVGDGFDPASDFGPLIDERAVLKVKHHVEDALAHGAIAVSGPFQAEGCFVRPVVLTGVTSEMRVCREETFGPVVPVMKFQTEAEAVSLANNTPYGLAAYFLTTDLARTFRLGEDLEFGMIGINTGAISMESAPFGGMKQSGLGREGGRDGLLEFMEIKTMHVAGLTREDGTP